MTFVADDAIEVVNREPPENIRIVICSANGRHCGCIDQWNGEVGMIKTLVMTRFVFRTKEQARAAMKDALGSMKERG